MTRFKIQKWEGTGVGVYFLVLRKGWILWTAERRYCDERWFERFPSFEDAAKYVAAYRRGRTPHVLLEEEEI